MKILVICHRRLGDTVVSEPVFRSIRDWNPAGELVALAAPYVHELLREIGSIDRILPDAIGGVLSFVRTIHLLRKEHFDLVVDLTTDYTLRTAAISFLCKSDFSVGYNIRGRGCFFEKAVEPLGENSHIVKELAHLAESAGIRTVDLIPKIGVSPQAKEIIHTFCRAEGIGEEEPVAGIHPGGHYPTQRWPTGKFAELADRLHKNAMVVLIGSDADMELVRAMQQTMRTKPIVFHADSIRALMAVLWRCTVLVCNNSGPLHLASALGTATVSTMGPTDPVRWWPLGKRDIVVRKNCSCMPCDSGRCRIGTNACMNEITVDEMWQHAVKILGTANIGR